MRLVFCLNYAGLLSLDTEFAHFFSVTLCPCSHLEDNQISVVERGAFQDLRLLERL